MPAQAFRKDQAIGDDFKAVRQRLTPLWLNRTLLTETIALHKSEDGGAGMKQIVITGAAGGIGRAVLNQLAKTGPARCALIDVDKNGLRAMADDPALAPLSLEPYPLDLRDNAALQHAMDDFAGTGEGIDALFANAGVMTGDAAFEDTPLDRIDRSIDLNFRCVATSTQTAWAGLAKARGQVIINASGAGLHPIGSDVVYSSSKAAAIMFARTNALNHAATGIRFNAICPGVVDTPILNDQSGSGWRDEVHIFTKHFDLITPDEIAETVLALIASEDRNGEVIEIRNRRKPA